MAGGCSLSRQQVRHLKINTPSWPLIVGLRLATALVACLTIATFAVCISTPVGATEQLGGGGAGNAWQWGDVWIEAFAFVPPVVSLLQTLVSIPYLLGTTHLIHPIIELFSELILVLVTAFPIAFCATVSGPLQQWRSAGSHPAGSEFAGILELISFVGLCLLEATHFGFFVSACRRTYSRRNDKLARARAAVVKLDAGWGVNDGEDFVTEETEKPVEEWKPRPELKRQVANIMAPPSAEDLMWRARDENVQTGRRPSSARRPSSVSEMSSWYDRRPSTRRPSSLSSMPQGRRATEESQIGMAVGKPHEIWVPITELRSETPLTPHRMVDERDVVIVGDGKVKVVSTPREEVFMGFSMPEPRSPRMAQPAELAAEKMALRRSDPDVPRPLQVRKSAKTFKNGNSWEMDVEPMPPPPVLNQGW